MEKDYRRLPNDVKSIKAEDLATDDKRKGMSSSMIHPLREEEV